MNSNDEIRVLYLALALALNALEKHTEDPRTDGDDAAISGESGGVIYNPEAKQWEMYCS